MGLKDFMQDLKTVKTCSFSHIADIKRSEIEGGLSFAFKHPALQTPIAMQMLVPEPDLYPGDHSYMLFVEGDCPAAVSSALKHVAQAVRAERLPDALTTISLKVSTRVEQSSERLADSPSNGPDEESQTQTDDDFDSDQYDEAGDIADVDALYESVGPVNTVFKQYATKANLSLMSSATLKHELVQAQSHGIAVGVYRSTPSHGTVASLAFPVSRLKVSARVLEAWGLDAVGYVVLLLGVRGLYPPAVKQVEQRDSFVYTDYRLGQCSTAKPSRCSLIGAFEEKPIETEAVEASGSDLAGDFKPVYMSRAIDVLLREQFLNLLYVRISRGLSWDEAQVHLVEFGRDFAKTDSEAAGTPKVSELDGPLPGDFVVNPGHGGLNLALSAFQLVLYRLEQCPKFCMVCFRPVKQSFEAIMPFVCGNILCFYHYNNLGIGVDINREVIERPYVVDMLACFFAMAVRDDRLRDRPLGLRLSSTRAKPDAPGNNSWQVQASRDLMKLREKPGPPQSLIRASPGLYFQLSTSLDISNPGASDPLCRLSYRDGNEWYFENLDGQLSLEGEGWRFATAFIMKTQVDELPWDEQRAALLGLLDQVPSVLKMREYLLERPGRKLESWSRLTASALRLLTWIVATNRSFITQDSEVPCLSEPNISTVPSAAATHRIGSLPPCTIQFRFAQGSPEKEEAFRKSMADEFPVESDSGHEIASMFAWHGSPLHNWHSILRSGLDFSVIAHGRASGHGVYFSSLYNTSILFSDMRDDSNSVAKHYNASHKGWRNSQLGITTAISICELVKKPSRFVSHSPHYVVNQVDWIQCRYLILKVAPTQAAINLPFPSPPTRPAKAFIPQDPAFVLRGQESQSLQIPDYVSETLGEDGVVNAQTGEAAFSAPDLGDDLDVALPTNEATGSKRRGSETGITPHDATNPPKLDNASYERKTRIVDDTIARNFVPGSLNFATLPKLHPPEWKRPVATARLQSEIRDMQRVQSTTDDIHSLGWYIDFENMTNIFHWIVELHSFDKSISLAKEMDALGITSIVLEVRFGSNYNMSPPFVRVVRPRFLPFAQGGGGHVTVGGAICSEMLTRSGWSSAYDMQKVLLALRVYLTDQERPARLLPAGGDYDAWTAFDAYKRAAKKHGWEVSQDLDEIAGQ